MSTKNTGRLYREKQKAFSAMYLGHPAVAHQRTAASSKPARRAASRAAASRNPSSRVAGRVSPAKKEANRPHRPDREERLLVRFTFESFYHLYL
jgi:hypothetical protein